MPIGGYYRLSLVPVIQPPNMVTIIVSLIVPDAAVLVGMLMLGNVMKECLSLIHI